MSYYNGFETHNVTTKLEWAVLVNITTLEMTTKAFITSHSSWEYVDTYNAYFGMYGSTIQINQQFMYALGNHSKWQCRMCLEYQKPTIHSVWGGITLNCNIKTQFIQVTSMYPCLHVYTQSFTSQQVHAYF